MKWFHKLSVFLVVVLMRVGVFAAPAVTTLPENRILLFNDYAASNTAVLVNQPWTLHDGPPTLSGSAVNRALLPGTNHFHRTGWRFLACRTGCAGYISGGRIVPPLSPLTVPIYPAIASNLAVNLRYEIGAMFESPVLTNGIGSIYFEAINNLPAYSGQLTVELATNMVEVSSGNVIPTVNPPSTNGFEYIWQVLDAPLDLNAATSNDFTRYIRTLNYRGSARIRIRRSGTLNPAVTNPDSALLVVDNIRVSPPPSSVVVYNPSAFNQFGNYVIQCFVSNADTNVPTDARTVTAEYRWANLTPPDNALTNAVMTRIDAGDGNGNGELYQLMLPTQMLGGDLEYTITCDFGGYMYQSPDYTGSGYMGYLPENLSPFTTAVQTQQLAGATLRTLTVNSGSGSGAYTNGQLVAITASSLTGQAFDRWTGATQYVENAALPTTTVTMPDFDIELTAIYTNVYYTLTVADGSGSGSYAYQQPVPIEADAKAGKVFFRWTGATQYVASAVSSNTVVTMPATNITLTATYLDAYVLTVNGGSGGGSYTNGQQVAITAGAPPNGQTFYRWTGDTAYIANVASSNTVVTMPALAVELTATYIDVHTLTVNFGDGDGVYTNGAQVAIMADAPSGGKIFYRWTGDIAYVANVASSNTVVTMPAVDIELTATYLDTYALTVNSGSGSGSYTNGEVVTITANAPAVGKVFALWTGATQYVSDATAPVATVTMPGAAVVLTATYSNVYYTLTVNGGSGSGPYTNGQVVVIEANVPSEKTFVQWTGDTAHVANITSPNTTVTIAAANVSLSALFSSQTSVLPDNRFLHFNDYVLTNAPNAVWVHEGPLPLSGSAVNRALLAGTNHYHVTGWTLFSCRAGSAAYIPGSSTVPPTSPATVPTYPAIASNLAANLRYDLASRIESPVFTNGIGTIYFDAVNSLVAYPGELTVDVATSLYEIDLGTVTNTVIRPPSGNWEYIWETIDVISLNATSTSEFTRYIRKLNHRSSAVLRIRRTGELNPGITNPDAAYVVIDNIRVSYPPSDVIVSKTDAPFEPGYPAVATNLTVRCLVDNADMNVPTDSRTPKVVYRWRYLSQVINPWQTNTMTYVEGTGDGQGNGELYQANLSLSPYSETGDLEYYYICDFGGYVYLPPDYTGLNYSYPSENLSPRLFRGTVGGEFTVRVRPYGSRYGMLYVEADTNQFPSPIEMVLVGEHEWRGMVPIAGTGITNLTWRFKAVGEYVPGSGAFSTGITYWASVSGITGGRVPYGGYCVETNENSQLNVFVDEGNYVLLTLNTDTLQYSAVRGEYQNFNVWPAPVNFFSESNGQDPKHSYVNTFDTWPTNEYRTYLQAFAGYPTTTNVFSRDPFFTFAPVCVAGSAAYVSERTIADNTVNAPVGAQKFRNVAMRLKGGDGQLGLGYIHNRVETLPDGLQAVTFKARLGQTSDNYDISYFRNGFTNFNYSLKATARAVSAVGLSPENPSVSLIGYYSDPDNFYEYRVVQVKDPADSAGTFSDKRISHQLYKWKNGVATLMTTAVEQTTSSSPLLSPSISDTAPLEMAFFNETTGTRIRCRFGAPAADKINIIEPNASGPYKSGTFGYCSSDCWSSFSYARTVGTISGATASGAEAIILPQDGTYDANIGFWYLPAGRYQSRNDLNPKGIYSVVPTQQIGVYVQPTVFGSDSEPLGPGSMDGEGNPVWQLAKTITVANFAYQNVTAPFVTAESQFVMLQVMGGEADVVVDEYSVSSWHGQENGLGNADVYQWVATESWVVTNAVPEASTVYLEHSRGDPTLDQALRSLLLETGMGLMEFDYRVLRGPAKLTVQYAPKRDVNDWTDVESFEFTNATSWAHASAYLGTNAPGYFRILNVREGIFTNAWVEINNATVWDEPTLTNNSWRAYNVKITSADTNRVALDLSKGCYLNNSMTLEASPPQTEFDPYLRSPELPKGFGKLTFYARAYTNNQAATLFLYATTNGWNAPVEQWYEVTRFENITNGLYKLFTYEPADGRNINAIKLGTKTRTIDRRVCIEDVTIFEPVLPGFDIVNVQLMERAVEGDYSVCSQPLEGEEVHVQAEIANQQLSPSNIVMYMSYYIGTNVWGIGNWPPGEVVTRRMTNNVPGNPFLYRTVPEGMPGLPASQTGGIVGQDRDQVVQYYVWADYMGGIPLTERQETFENPAWYYPIDLNAKYAQLGWSPYFFVYGVPVNSVWINEVNATDYMESGGVQQFGIWDNAYIEIAVPAWLDLGGWSVELVTTADYQVRTITIPYGLPEQTVYTNGYAFFVIGDAAPPDPGVPALPKVDYAYPDLKYSMPRLMPGGLRLRRPLGMYEQASAYDWDTNILQLAFSGTNWAAQDPQKKFVYVGQENNGGSLSVTNGYGKTAQDWIFPLEWTPGKPNVGQIVPNGDSLLPGVSNVLITSIMNSDQATQNGRRVTYYTLKMRKGMSTNIVYTTDAWYRLFSVTKDLVEQLPSLGTETNFTLQLPDLQSDVGVNVDVRLRQDLSDQGLDADVLDWVLSFQDGELIPMYYNDRLLSLTEQYWIDAPPTRSNTFELAIAKLVLDPGTNFHVTVKMALNDEKKSAFQGQAVLKLQAKSRLLDSEWTMVTQYSLTVDSFDANNTCRVFVPNPFELELAGFDPQMLFFRWAIEVNDPRVATHVLVNDPE
jgi:hypothetical protein